MKGSMLDILVRVFNAVNHERYGEPEMPNVIDSLLDAGFTYEHIRRALDWRDRFVEEMPQPLAADHPLRHSTRIFTPEECKKLPPDARAFLQKMENDGIVDAGLREFIIEQAMGLDLDEIKTPYFMWVVYVALEHHTGCKQNFSWMEDLILGHDPNKTPVIH